MGSNGWPDIPIAPCDPEGHGLAPVVDGQMELEAKEPANLLVPGSSAKEWRNPGPTP